MNEEVFDAEAGEAATSSIHIGGILLRRTTSERKKVDTFMEIFLGTMCNICDEETPEGVRILYVYVQLQFHYSWILTQLVGAKYCPAFLTLL